jgi:hypothetical protein
MQYNIIEHVSMRFMNVGRCFKIQNICKRQTCAAYTIGQVISNTLALSMEQEDDMICNSQEQTKGCEASRHHPGAWKTACHGLQAKEFSLQDYSLGRKI